MYNILRLRNSMSCDCRGGSKDDETYISDIVTNACRNSFSSAIVRQDNCLSIFSDRLNIL